jgi:hypothetical protein
VCGKEYCHIFLLAQIGNNSPDHLPRLRIESGGGLVKNEYARTVEYGASDVNAPSLSAREL